MPLNPHEITEILDALQESDWDEAVVTVDGVSIAVSRRGPLSAAAQQPAVLPAPVPVAAPGPQSAPAAPAPAAPQQPAAVGQDSDLVVVTAPSVGVFWRSPRPGMPPFVEVGGQVAVGDTVCIVEMMKLMNNVVSEVAGTVVAVHVENAAQVEYGVPLISIRPVAA